MDDTALPFATLLNLLFEYNRADSGRPFTEAEVAKHVGMSQSSISALRLGNTQNPRLNNVRAICRFFEVPLTYLDASSEAEAINIILQQRHQNPPDPDMATRLAALSDEAMADLERILRWVQRAHNRVSHGN